MTVVAVKSGDDLAAVRTAYLERIDADSDEALVVELAAGRYERASFGTFEIALRPPATSPRPRFDVTLRGAAGPAPTITHSGVTIVARRILLEHLVFGPRRGSATSLRLDAHATTLRDCVLTGHQLDAQQDSALIQAVALPGGDDHALILDDVRITDVTASVLLDAIGAPGSGWRRVQLTDCVFVGNRGRDLIRVDGAGTIDLTRCVAVVAGAGAFLRHGPADRSRLADCTLVVERAELAVVSPRSSATTLVQGVLAVRSNGGDEPRLERTRVAHADAALVDAVVRQLVADPGTAARAAAATLGAVLR